MPGSDKGFFCELGGPFWRPCRDAVSPSSSKKADGIIVLWLGQAGFDHAQCRDECGVRAFLFEAPVLLLWHCRNNPLLERLESM